MDMDMNMDMDMVTWWHGKLHGKLQRALVASSSIVYDSVLLTLSVALSRACLRCVVGAATVGIAIPGSAGHEACYQ